MEKKGSQEARSPLRSRIIPKTSGKIRGTLAKCTKPKRMSVRNPEQQMADMSRIKDPMRRKQPYTS